MVGVEPSLEWSIPAARVQELHVEQESEDEGDDTCTGDFVDVGGLDILGIDEFMVLFVALGCWSPAERGKVTGDSGAVESQMPRDTSQYETSVWEAAGEIRWEVLRSEWRHAGRTGRRHACA